MKKIAILLSLIFLSGCGNDVLECNDNEAKDGAMKAVADLYKFARISNFDNVSDFEISNIKTISHGTDGIKENLCSAEYSFSYKGKQYKTDFIYKLSFLEDKKTTEVSVSKDTRVSIF